MLVLIGVIAVPCGWYAANHVAMLKEDAILQSLVVDEEFQTGLAVNTSLEHHDCLTFFSGSATRQPTNAINAWAGRYMPNVFERIVAVDFEDSSYDDQSLRSIIELPHLRQVKIFCNGISDESIEEFKRVRPDVVFVVEREF